MLVYYFVPFIVSNRYLLFWVSNGHNFVNVQNRTHVYMNFFHHKDLGNHLLQLCPKVVKHLYIQGVSKPMSQTFPGYSPPQNKQKRSYQHGSKNEQVPRCQLTFMCWYPFEYHIRCSKCSPFAATHPLRRHIMDSLMRSSWPVRFLMA